MFFRKDPVLFFLLIFVFLGTGVSAQSFKLSGVVRDADSFDPLPVITVILEGTEKGINTNLEGEFEFFVQPDTYIVKVKYSGYQIYRDTVVVGDSAPPLIQVLLKPVSVSITGLEITSKWVNPALRIVRNAIKHRKYNNMDNIAAYEYESYNKMVISMDNVTDKFLSRPIVRGVGKILKELGTDTTRSDTTQFTLAVFLSESVSKFYYRKPNMEKEEILAVHTSGVKGSEYNLLGTMFLQINLYGNFVNILGRQLINPIADGAMIDYTYELIHYEIDGRDTLYGIRIIPRADFSPTFKGTMWIDNHDWAINRIDLELNSDPNINFVEDVRIRQEFQKTDSFWVPIVQDLEVDFQNSPFKRKGKSRWIGPIGRSSSYLYNYKINEPKELKFFQNELLEVREDAEDKDSIYWQTMRKSPLDQSEKTGFELVERVQKRGILDFYIRSVEIITTGTIRVKWLEIGPYYYFFGSNQAEGFRMRVGAETNKHFSKRFFLKSHIAYGFKDKRIKYLSEARAKILKKPRLEIGILKVFEVEQVGFENFLEEGTSMLETMLRRVPLTQLNYYNEHKLTLWADILRGLSAEFYFRTKYFHPASTFPFAYVKENGDLGTNYSVSEAGAEFRISFKEQFITVGGERTYIGTPYPVFFLGYKAGFKNFLGGEFSYHELSLKIQNKIKTGRFGQSYYFVKAGWIFGEMPFPNLYVFRGNQTWGWREIGFNMMNYYEFVADRYITASVDHHFQGFFLNKIPWIRKLKLKEIASFRMGWGTLTDRNKALNNIPEQPWNGFPGQSIKAPDRAPYMEAGVGLENILKLIRIDAIWRLNYLNSNLPHWGKRHNFGIRAHLTVRF